MSSALYPAAPGPGAPLIIFFFSNYLLLLSIRPWFYYIGYMLDGHNAQHAVKKLLHIQYNYNIGLTNKLQLLSEYNTKAVTINVTKCLVTKYATDTSEGRFS